MGKNTALTNNTTLTLTTDISGNPRHSVEAYKELVKKVFEMEKQGIADGTYNETCQGVDPYHNSDWEIVVAAAGESKYTVTFTSESRTTGNDAIGRAALSERRNVEISLTTSSTLTGENAMLSVLNEIQKIEDKVASTGNGAYADGALTVRVKGRTPYEGSATYTVTKSGDEYVTSLA